MNRRIKKKLQNRKWVYKYKDIELDSKIDFIEYLKRLYLIKRNAMN